MPTSIALKAKLLKPCKKLIHRLKFTLKRPIHIGIFRFRRIRLSAPGKTQKKKSFRGWLPFHRWWSMKTEENDRVGELRIMPEMGQERALFPSPITPAYLKNSRAISPREGTRGDDIVQDSCRSFEKYLVEMVVEEGNVSDLTDVEELLYCWKNLKCPVFHDLVCRFYGELCKDLFSGEEEELDDSK